MFQTGEMKVRAISGTIACEDPVSGIIESPQNRGEHSVKGEMTYVNGNLPDFNRGAAVLYH